jgi:hypothetical protein
LVARAQLRRLTAVGRVLHDRGGLRCETYSTAEHERALADAGFLLESADFFDAFRAENGRAAASLDAGRGADSTGFELMHVGIFGPTTCGKTTLARALSGQYAKAGRASLVCDPLGIPWTGAAWQTTDATALMEKAKRSQNCMLWVEEASMSVSRDRSLSWLFTTARHHGHVTHVIGQDGSSLLPAMRQQISTLYLFRCHPDLADIWARQFCDPQIAALSPTLQRYEFIVCRPYEPVKVRKLELV